MHQFFGQLSLLRGWLPPTLQALALVVLVAAIRWRERRWRRWVLPAALIAAAALTATAYWYLGSLGVAGDPAPTSLWLWTAMTSLAAAVLVLGWPGAGWARRGLTVLAVPLCAACAAPIAGALDENAASQRLDEPINASIVGLERILEKERPLRLVIELEVHPIDRVIPAALDGPLDECAA